ncbi:MAG: thiamine-phosphate kinase [Byssovorax sp.]
MPRSEWAKIALLERVLGGAPDARVLTGIGDDAAVLAPPAAPLVWTVDAAVDDVHFRRDLVTMVDIGYRSTMAAASDLAAMGASPRGMLSSLILPAGFPDEDLEALARGQREAADALGTQVIGGNLARGEQLSITTTVLGAAPRPLLRSGARPGDALWIAGPSGLAGAGLALLLAGAKVEREAARRAVRAWQRPLARIADGLRAAAVAHAAIDVSDGLGQDVGHMAQASGVRAVLSRAALLAIDPALAAVAGELGRDPLDLALRGGEDYALVVALPAGEALAGFVEIGRIEASADGGDEAGEVLLEREDGAREILSGAGFDHFRP